MVAGGAREHTEWAWLTRNGLAQDGKTPLHRAARSGKEAMIKALLAAKADVHAKDEVGVGAGGRVRRGGRGESAAWVVHCNIVVWSCEPEVVERPNREPLTQPSTRNLKERLFASTRFANHIIQSH